MIAFLVGVLGTVVLYHTSARKVKSNGKVGIYILGKARFFRIIGAIALMRSLWLFMMQYGIGVGIFYALVSFMTLISMLVMLVPLFKMRE